MDVRRDIKILMNKTEWFCHLVSPSYCNILKRHGIINHIPKILRK